MVGYSSRNAAIDILRALTMVLWFAHAKADQDFLGLSDIVFPCFLSAVGMSIPYALENSFSKCRSGVLHHRHSRHIQLSTILSPLHQHHISAYKDQCAAEDIIMFK